MADKKQVELLNKFKKNSKIKETVVFAESDFHTKIDYVPTKIPLINLALSGKFFNGGISRGVTILAGESRSGKTIFMLLCLKSYLDKYEDAIGILWDSEFSFTPQYLKSIGIDTSRVLVTPVTSLESFKNDIVSQLDMISRGEHVFLGVDSLGALPSLKELEDSKEDKQSVDMTRAKTAKSVMRMITPEVNMKDIPFFGITHSYQTLEIYSKAVVSGGTAYLYSANTVLLFSRRKNQNKDEEGYEFVIKIEKSRFCKDTIKLPLVAPKNGTFKKWSSMYDLAVEYGYINAGAWVEVPCLSSFEGKKVRRKEIEDSDEFWKMMFEETDFINKVETAVCVSQDQSSLFNDIEEEYQDAINNSKEVFEDED